MQYSIWTLGISDTDLVNKYTGLASLTKVAENQVVNTNGGRFEGTTQWRAEWPDLVPFTIVAQMDDFVVAMSDELDPEEALEDAESSGNDPNEA